MYNGNDAALKRLVQGYDRVANPNNDQIIRHLRSIQYRLASNNFDHLDD